MNDIERGCESVYEDLGHPDAEEMMVKAQLAAKIGEIIAERQWSHNRRPLSSVSPNPSFRK